jgi:hypothetical protein
MLALNISTTVQHHPAKHKSTTPKASKACDYFRNVVCTKVNGYMQHMGHLRALLYPHLYHIFFGAQGNQSINHR